jgi:hypothetical protein
MMADAGSQGQSLRAAIAMTQLLPRRSDAAPIRGAQIGEGKCHRTSRHCFGAGGFAKVRYRGLDKNAHRLFVTCALANLFMARRWKK